jgi:hypothetical protein
MRFAQEARMYTLLTLNVALATGALLYLLTDHRARIVPLGRQLAQCFRRSSAFTPSECTLATDLAWAGYLLFTLAALLTHNTAIFYPVAANLFVLGFIGWHHFRPQSGRFQPTSLQNWLIAQLILFLLWSPWLPAFITQSVGVDREFWMSTPHLGDVLWALKNFFSAFLPDHAAGGNLIWVGYGLLTLLGLVHFRAEPTRAALLLFLFLTPIVGELLVSLRRPIFSYHTLIWASIPLYLLLAAGLRLLRWRVLIMAGTLWLVALNLISLNEYYTTFRKEEWDDAAHYVAEHAQGNDLILFNATWVQIPFDFYFHDYHRPVLEHGVPVDLFDRGVLEPKMTAADLPRLHDLISGHDRIWLVYSHDWYTDPQAIVRTTLSEALTLIDEREFFGLKLYLYSAR